MKKAFKRILSVAIGLCIALMGMFVMPTITASAETKKYVKVTSAPTDWSGKYLIVYEDGKVIFDGSRTTMDDVSNTQSVTISDNAIMADNSYSFTIAKDDSNYTVQSASGYYIGQTSNANGLVSSKTTTYTNTISLNDDGSVNFVSGGAYLRFNATSGQTRFRYFKSGTYTNQKAICLYKLEENTGTDTPVQQAAVNEISAYMRLAYTYKAKTEIQEATDTTDVLNLGLTGVTGTTYTSWSGKTSESTAVYAGQSAGGNSSIQLRSSGSNSGIITTASGGKVKKITVTWNSGTASGRTLDVYGKNTAYSSPTELYSSSTRGTKIGSIVCGTSTELVVEGDYTYIGLRSNSSAMYLTQIQITWGNEEKQVTTLEDDKFIIQCAVDKAVLDIKDVDEAGICVTASTENKDYIQYYNKNTAVSWTEEGDKVYVVINLGNLGAHDERMIAMFTVAAYVKVGENVYTTEIEEKVKVHSVASMVKEYYEDAEITEVEHLYNYLLSKSLITEGN